MSISKVDFDSAQARLADTVDRMARLAEARLDDAERDLTRQEKQAAQERRDQIRRHADSIRRHADRYQDAFGAFDRELPPPVDGEFPGDYRRRLLQRLIDKLPSDHELADCKADELDSDLIKLVEPQVIEAALKEAEKPSPENLPADGSLIERRRTDDMGQRFIEWRGRESFIKAMNRPAQRVVRLMNPRSGEVLLGQAPAKAERTGLWA